MEADAPKHVEPHGAHHGARVWLMCEGLERTARRCYRGAHHGAPAKQRLAQKIFAKKSSLIKDF